MQRFADAYMSRLGEMAEILTEEMGSPISFSNLLGVRRGSRPNAALEWIRANDYETAFTGESQKSLPVTRRGIMRMRREVGELGQLGGSPPTGSARQSRWPEWQHVVRFVNRMRGASSDGN